MKKYQQIGNWQVNTEIPENIRAILNNQINDWDRGIVPTNLIWDMFHGINFGYDYLFDYGRLAQQSTEQEKVLLEEMKDRIQKLFQSFQIHPRESSDLSCLTQDEIILLARLNVLHEAKTQTEAKFGRSYYEHALLGSTTDIPPNPFILMGSYFRDKIQDETERLRSAGYKYAEFRDRKNGVVSLGQKLFRVDPVERFKDLRGLYEKKNREYDYINFAFYFARSHMDINTKEARIEPDTERNKHYQGKKNNFN